MKTRQNSGKRGVATVFVVELVVAALVVVCAWWFYDSVTKDSSCLPSGSAGAAPPSTGANAAPPANVGSSGGGSVLDGNSASGDSSSSVLKAVIDFGRQEGPKGTIVVLPATTTLSDFKPVIVGEVRRDGPGGAAFDRSKITLGIAKRGDFVELSVCADRRGAAPPGSYDGQIQVASDNGSAVVVPLSLSLADTNVPWVVLAGTVSILFGNLYLFALFEKLAADEVVDMSMVKRYIKWCGALKSLVAGVFGLAAAATVFNAQYLASDTFGSSPWQYPTLLVSMIAAFIGAGSTASVPVAALTNARGSGGAQQADADTGHGHEPAEHG